MHMYMHFSKYETCYQWSPWYQEYHTVHSTVRPVLYCAVRMELKGDPHRYICMMSPTP